VPLHFAYGSNMDADAMARRCPQARLVGPARLAGWRFALMPSGYATIVPDPRAHVHGALWDVAVAGVAALDRYEQIGLGLYQKRSLRVLRPPAGSAQALVYVGAKPELGAAPRNYLGEIIAAARSLALPADYLGFLAALAAAQKKGAPA
jgi:gamma-glutamylcyclotransferase (GGCT)/AIG2-like uncharacterized protein YtfP